MFVLPLLIFLFSSGGNANPLYSFLPTTAGVGTSNIFSTFPGLLGQQVISTSPTVQSPYVQLLRQPGISSLGGLGSGSLGLTQLLNGQNVLLNNAAGVLPLGTGLTSTNGLGLTNTLPNGLSVVNINGVPVLVQSGLGLQNGLQTGITTLPQLGGSPIYQQPIIATQPTFGVNPVVRDVGVDVVEETPAALVQMDPMDAALLDMENQGQIHMEKYAWGRSNLNKPQIPENTGQLRSEFPRTYTQVPVGGIISSQQPLNILNQNRVVDAVSPTPSQTRNPFVDANGKRKKHFEFYQYFRNLNMNQPQGVIAVPVFPPTTDDGNK